MQGSATFSPIPGFDLTKLLFKPTHDASSPSTTNRTTKISVIGVGHVGMAIAHTILTQDLADELCLLDSNPTKLRGEMLDLQHAAAFLPRTKIAASTDYSVTSRSDLCIITAGARRKVSGESRFDLVQRNLAMFVDIVPQVVNFSPDTILLVVTNPVDIMSYVAWKLSRFPANRVIGSGTNLDSSRFRFLIADHLDVNAQDVQAYIVGEHGTSSVALWSSCTVGGIPILSYLDKEHISYEETLSNIHKSVMDSANEVLTLKQYTSWAIGYSVASLARTILRDQRKIHPVSVLAKGFYGIEGGNVFLSVPVQLGRGGVLGVADVNWSDDEGKKLRESANTLLEVQSKLQF